MDYLTTLNEAQRKAVMATEGPILVLAGAGAGKTKTITHRMLHLIKLGVAPETILAVTFTNKAAKEMRERVETMLALEDPELQGQKRHPLVLTFHALGVMILRNHVDILGLPKHFAIFDRSDSIKAIKEALKTAGVSDKQLEPRAALSMISKQKGAGVTFERFQSLVGNTYSARLLSDVWNAYDRILRREKALDFDDLLLMTLTLLSTHEDIRTRYQKAWQYIHIDEYQDTNKVQYALVRIFAAKHRNICCVGDLDQNIYSWRGSTIDNILMFEKEFPEAEVVLLEQNYRSTRTIVDAANHIIQKNKKRKEKRLFTENEEGEKLTIFSAYDEEDEATFVAGKIADLLEHGVRPEEIAVLYRANFQSRVLEDAMLVHTVPYRVLGTKFFERKEIKDLLAYVRASLNPESITDIRRIINVPVRGVGAVTTEKLITQGLGAQPPAMQAKITAFYATLSEIQKTLASSKPSEGLRTAIKLSGIENDFKGEEQEERMENLRELVTLAARKYDSLTPEEGIEALLSDASLATDQDELDEHKPAVVLMTIHAAKGLEFPYVFITGLEDGLFPHERLSNDGVDEEEERRLFYVALTRAMKKITLSYAQVRTIFGSRQVRLPSEFITDLDENFVEIDASREHQYGSGTSKVIYID